MPARITHNPETAMNAPDPIFALESTCQRLRELHRQRQDLHRAEKSLTLQIRAKCRRVAGLSFEKMAEQKKEADKIYAAIFGEGDHPAALLLTGSCEPFIQARDGIVGVDVKGKKEVVHKGFIHQRAEIEKQMEALAKTLPVAPWVAATKGFGFGNLAAVIAETGNLSLYANPAKVWKRMGLAVIGGGRQRRVTGKEALKHGYSPTRRSVMWNVGQCLFRAQSARVDKETGEIKTPAGPLRVIYDEQKALCMAKLEARAAADPEHAKKYMKLDADGEPIKYSPKAHAHNMALRYVEKRALRDLWRAWRDAVGGVCVDGEESE